MASFQIPGYVITIYNLIQVLFIVVDILLGVGFVYSFAKAWHFHPSFTGGGHGEDAHGSKHKPTLRDAVMKERWHSVQKKVAVGTPEAARLAIIEADALVDTALKGMQIPGDHMADRLSNLNEDDIKSMNRVWRAHRLRNDLVHTPGFAVSASDAQRAIDDYEAFMKEMQVID